MTTDDLYNALVERRQDAQDALQRMRKLPSWEHINGVHVASYAAHMARIIDALDTIINDLTTEDMS